MLARPCYRCDGRKGIRVENEVDVEYRCPASKNGENHTFHRVPDWRDLEGLAKVAENAISRFNTF